MITTGMCVGFYERRGDLDGPDPKTLLRPIPIEELFGEMKAAMSKILALFTVALI